MSPDDFRKQAEALYTLAKLAHRADEGLILVLQALEYEARAQEAERKLSKKSAGGGESSRSPPAESWINV